MTKDQIRVITVLERIIGMVGENQDDCEMFQMELEDMLDEIASNDGFGSECQVDPRGDMRNDQYSMSYVSGVDD